jgi:hypothetical protein
MSRAEHIGERVVHLIPELPCPYGRKLSRALFHELREGLVHEIPLLVIPEGRLMDYDERVEARMQGSLEVALPLQPVCRVVPVGPVQGVADMADTEVPDVHDTLLIEAMHPDADRRVPGKGGREAETERD